MNKKDIIGLIVLIAMMTSTVVVAGDYTQQNISDTNRTTLNVSGMGSNSVESLITDIYTIDSYKNHDNKTIEWLYTMINYRVFTSEDYFVLMSTDEANKLPTEFATDVIITDTFSCNVLENKTLGNGMKNILLVDNVEFKNQSVESIEV